jgi:uncharacterized protein YecE (DUF72 family)
MITIGCAGFPGPATRYFKEFFFVEIQEVHPTRVGMGTLRRWRREATNDFTFAMLAPREIGQEGFREGKVVETSLEAMFEAGKELGSGIAIFASPPDFAQNRANKSAVKDFLSSVRKKFNHVVWEAPPSWNAADAAAIAADAKVIPARDPLTYGMLEAPVAYYRMPGPAGHKSRYEDHAILKLADLARSANHTSVTYVFSNVDMFTDAKRFKKALKI